MEDKIDKKEKVGKARERERRIQKYNKRKEGEKMTMNGGGAHKKKLCGGRRDKEGEYLHKRVTRTRSER